MSFLNNAGFDNFLKEKQENLSGDMRVYDPVMIKQENKQDVSWVDNNYSLFLAGDHDEPGRGQNGFFTENDTTFMVYHAYT